MSSGAKIALSMSAGPADVIRKPPTLNWVPMERWCNPARRDQRVCVYGHLMVVTPDTKQLEGLVRIRIRADLGDVEGYSVRAHHGADGSDACVAQNITSAPNARSDALDVVPPSRVR